MRRIRVIVAISAMIFLSLPVFSQTSNDRPSFERGVRSYIENYGNGRSGFPVTSSVTSINIDDNSREVRITVNESFSAQEFTPEIVDGIYKRLRSLLPEENKGYNIKLFTHGYLIEDLVPNRLRERQDRNRQWGDIDYKGKPWVTNTSRPNEISRGLDGRHLTIAASHGRYFDQKTGRWRWQRPNLFCTTEDLFTQTVVVPYLMPMLENAGAIVWSPRERDWQKHELIVDNDTPSPTGHYAESSLSTHPWGVAPCRGFAYHSGSYGNGENPFTAGTVRMVESSSSAKNVSKVFYRPEFPESGRYAVYVSYATLEGSVDDAEYIVWHKGRRTIFHVNQRMGGGTWVYLGTFDFDKGTSNSNMVELSNHSKHRGGIVTTDAVRFGGGMGNISRGGSVSGVPRCLEGSRYSAQWGGAPDSVYNRFNNTNDYNDDLNARSRYSNWLAGGSCFVPNSKGLGVPIELMLSVHSDAGHDKNGGNALVGTLSICTTDFYEGKLNAGISRMASHDLADALLYNAWADIQTTYGHWRRRVLWDRNYNETREPAVPSAILEIMSHQNFGDMRFGLDPNFRFTLARSIYKTILRYVNEMHGTKYTVQPLAPRNFRIEFSSKGKLKLSWNPVKDPLESSAVPTEYKVYTAIGNGGFDNGVIVKGTSCAVNAEAGKLYHFRVTACNNGGESFPTEVLSAEYVPSSKKTVLVVNGFNRLSSPEVIDTGARKGFDLDADPGVTYGPTAGWSGRQTVFDNKRRGQEGEGALGYCGNELVGVFVAGNDFNYVAEHAEAIHSAGQYNILSCSSEALESGKVKLSDVSCIDLVLGLEKDDGHSLLIYKAFSENMQNQLRKFTRNGGSLLVSGSYVGSDMKGTNDLRFLNEVLKLSCGGSDHDNPNSSVHGLGMTFDIWRTINETHYAATSPDVLNPIKGSNCVMRYSDGRDAAVAYSGRDYKTFTMGFPLECIKDTKARNAIMRGILKYLIK